MDIRFNENGLVPAVVQDYKTNQVLMVAYMNKESLSQTITSGKAVFFSRSRQALWCKGETSGNFMHVKEIKVDCDEDCLLILVDPAGPACHTGEETCFYRKLEDDTLVPAPTHASSSAIMEELYATIVNRKEHPKEGSYTNYLFEKGIDKILKKVGEETAEVIIGAKNPGNDEIRYEIADLMYHLSVLMVEKDLCWEEVYKELVARHK